MSHGIDEEVELLNLDIEFIEESDSESYDSDDNDDDGEIGEIREEHEIGREEADEDQVDVGRMVLGDSWEGYSCTAPSVCPVAHQEHISRREEPLQRDSAKKTGFLKRGGESVT